MAWVRQDSMSVMKGLDVIAQTNSLLSELLITEAGCDGVYYCVQSGEPDRFTAEEYRKIVRPSDLYVLERANRFSDNNIIHLCGRMPVQMHEVPDEPVFVGLSYVRDSCGDVFRHILSPFLCFI